MKKITPLVRYSLCGPRSFLLVHWLNSWFLLVHSSSSNMFFKIAKRLFKGHGENVKFVCYPRMFGLFIEIYWSAVVAILQYYWRVLNVFLNKSPISIMSPICFQLTMFHQRTILKVIRPVVVRTTYFSIKKLILSRDPVPLNGVFETRNHVIPMDYRTIHRLQLVFDIPPPYPPPPPLAIVSS